MRVRIGARFAGPPGAANGGFLAGTLAGEGPARVTIRRPVPVEDDLVLEGGELREARGERDEATPPLAVVEPVERVDVGEVPRVTHDEAREAAAATPLAADHPFPRCFGCGPAHPDGLHCLAGEVRDGVWAVPWTPGEASSPFVWSALDCPSSAPVVPVDGHPPHVLGRIEGAILGPVAVGEPHVVVAWALGADGRRKHSASALLDPSGEPVAVARATWFALA